MLTAKRSTNRDFKITLNTGEQQQGGAVGGDGNRGGGGRQAKRARAAAPEEEQEVGSHGGGVGGGPGVVAASWRCRAATSLPLVRSWGLQHPTAAPHPCPGLARVLWLACDPVHAKIRHSPLLGRRPCLAHVQEDEEGAEEEEVAGEEVELMEYE